MEIEEIKNLIKNLRKEYFEYRLARLNKDVSLHCNAIEIVVCLSELAIYENRPIAKEYENWFEAGYYLELIFDNSEWTNLSNLYTELVKTVKDHNFFR